jgi:hypothetical protein
MPHRKHVGTGGIFTYTGEFVHPLALEPDRIHIEDIAHALANQCRFTGHVRKFYSVAQHSVYVSRIVPAEWKLWGLLHDGSEAYLSDLASPLKHQTEFGAAFREVEDSILLAICERFDLRTDLGDKPPEIARADDMLLWAEIRDLMPQEPIKGEAAWKTKIRPWLPEVAERKFLEAYSALSLQFEAVA